jgi:hypothetical protein
MNGDLVVDVDDCTGPQGPAGPIGPVGLAGADGLNGINCWDLNGNGIGDLPTEDLNGDMVVDVNDCTGPLGPPGPGVIMAWGGNKPMSAMPVACSEFPGVEVTIIVPTDGFIVLSATVVTELIHIAPVRDVINLKITPILGDCADDMWTRIETVAGAQPSDSYWPTTHLDRVESVTAGTYTFYVTGVMMLGGGSTDFFWSGSITAVFYAN